MQSLKKKLVKNPAWWHTPIVPRRLKQEDCLDYREFGLPSPQIIADFSDTRALSSKHGVIHWPPGPGKNRSTPLWEMGTQKTSQKIVHQAFSRLLLGVTGRFPCPDIRLLRRHSKSVQA